MTAIEQRVALLHAMHHHFGGHRIDYERIVVQMTGVAGFPIDRLAFVIDAMKNEGLLNHLYGIGTDETQISERGIEYLNCPPPEPPPPVIEKDYGDILKPLRSAKTKAILKNAYRKLVKEYHSDKGGDGEVIKHITNLYAEREKILKR